MKKGLSDAVFIPEWDTETFLSTAGTAGFKGVELNLRENAGDITLNTSPSEIKAIERKAANSGLEIPTLSSGLFNFYSLATADDNLRKHSEFIGSRMIELAAEIGTPVIQVVPGVVTPSEPYEEAYERAKESLYRLGEKATAAGVTVAIENVRNKFLPSPLEFVNFLNEINHPNVQAYLDIGNAMITGFPEHLIHLLGERIVAMHVKDYRHATGDFVGVLDGDLNWPVLIEALDGIPYQEYLIATPPYQSSHSPQRLVHAAYRDLCAVCDLSSQFNFNVTKD